MRVKENGEMDFMDVWYPIQVKQTDKVGRPDIDAFETAMNAQSASSVISLASISPVTRFSKSIASAERWLRN